MQKMNELSPRQIVSRAISRRLVLGGAAAIVASPVLAEQCRIGPPEHPKGPLVWLDLDQVELDAAYDQSAYAPLGGQIRARFSSASEEVRTLLGAPQRLAYGPSEFEKLDIYRTKRPRAPIFVYFHGGAWLRGSAKDSAFPAEMFVRAGARNDFNLPETVVKGGLCESGMYDLKAVRLSARSKYVKFADQIEEEMSPQRHLDLIRAPVVVTYGTNETPEFQHQSHDFVAAMKAAGKPVELIVAENFNHFETEESLGNPYGPNGRAALALMKLAPA